MNIKKGDILKQKIKMELCGGGKEDVDLPIGTEWIVVSVEDDNEYCHIKIASGLDGSKTGAPMKISSLGEYFEL